MRVIELVKAHLEANGFDGLCHGETECGCYIANDGTLGDFHICGGSFADCEPAYKIDLPPGDSRGDWWMTTKKPGTCGKVRSGVPCDLPEGHKCPDCGLALHDFGGPD